MVQVLLTNEGLEGGVWIPNHGLILHKFPNHVACSHLFPNHVLWENVFGAIAEYPATLATRCSRLRVYAATPS